MTTFPGATVRLARRFLSLAACSLLALPAAAQPTSTSPLAPPANGMRRADPSWVALSNATIHVTPGAPPLEHATLLARDGRIVAILPGEPGTAKDGSPTLVPARTPIGPRLIDCTGLHLYPGFIEPCFEVDTPAPAGEEAAKHWNPKVTPQRSALDAPRLDDNAAGSLRRLGFTAVAISPKGGIFRGQSALTSLAKPADEPSAAKPAAYRSPIYQSIAMDSSGGGYPDSQMGAIAVIRQTLGDAQWQAARRKAGAFSSPPNALDPLAALLESSPKQAAPSEFQPVKQSSSDFISPWLFHSESELDLFRIKAITEEFGLRHILILGSGAEYRRPAGIPAGATLLLPLNFPKTPDVGSLAKQEGVDLRELMAWEQAPTNPRRLKGLGVDFALTTARLQNRGDFWSNLRLAVRHGLDEATAIQGLTVRAAAALGASDLMGTLETGKLANIAVFDGPALGKNADNKDSKLRGVWIDGAWHEVTAIPVSFEGTWDVAIPVDPRPVTRRLEIDRDNGITFHRNGKQVKASKVEAATGRLSFVFDHDALDGEEGTCSMMAMVAAAEGGASPAIMTGIGISGTGKRYEWTATRRPKSLVGLWPFIPARAGDASHIIAFNDQNEATARAVTATDPAVKPETLSYDGSSVGFTLGDTTFAGSIDWSVPATPRITVTAGDASWIATRRELNPFKGTWRVTSYDGKPVADGNAAADSLQLTLTDANVTITKTAKGTAPVVIKAKDVKFQATGAPGSAKPDAKPDAKPGDEPPADTKPASDHVLSLTFTHDLAPLGGEGASSDTISIAFNTDPSKDVIRGSSTLSIGGTHAYEAIRIDDPTSDEGPSVADIPEQLPTPFNPFGLTEQPEQPAHLIISNATIWTNGPAGVIPKGYVYVRAGTIAMVGAGDPSIAVPQGERSVFINAEGRHLTAGIVDCHSHTGISGGVNESGQAVTSECRISDVTNPDVTNWYQQLAGGVTSVLSLHGSANAIGGQSQTIRIRWGCASPQDMHFDGAMPGIKFALGENPRRANSGTGNARYPATRLGVEMLIRDRFTAAAEYIASRSRPDFRRDLELEPLAEILEGKRLIHCHSYRQDEMLMLALLARDLKFRIGTYQHALEGYKVADAVRDFSGGASGFADWWAYKVEVQDAIPEAFPIMAEQGAVVSYNSDSNEMARRLNVEAAKAVKYGGVSEEEALKYVTLNPARQLKIEHRVGSIEEGKDADLALWSGPPLSAFSRCESTWVEGRRLFSLEQDASMRARVKADRMRLIQKALVGNKKKETPAADDAKPASSSEPRPEGGRRRRGRPPQEGDASAQDATDQAAEAIKRYYIELHNYRHFSQQGVCGCDIMR